MYTKKIFKIYIWKTLSIILGFLSLALVIPKISSNKEIYGIYMVCVSAMVMLRYADLGFYKAVFKYSAEYYAKGELDSEIKMVGFNSFVMLIIIAFISLVHITNLSLSNSAGIPKLND